MALLKHVDPREPAGRGDQSLFHGGWIHQLPVQDGAADTRGQGVCKGQVSQLVGHSADGMRENVSERM